jgi:hypothetical protein
MMKEASMVSEWGIYASWVKDVNTQPVKPGSFF